MPELVAWLAGVDALLDGGGCSTGSTSPDAMRWAPTCPGQPDLRDPALLSFLRESRWETYLQTRLELRVALAVHDPRSPFTILSAT